LRLPHPESKEGKEEAKSVFGDNFERSESLPLDETSGEETCKNSDDASKVRGNTSQMKIR